MKPRYTAVTLLAVVALFASRAAAGRAAEEGSRNAALQYWQAIASFLTSQHRLSDKQREALFDPMKANLDDAAIRELLGFQSVFVFVHRGAAIGRCDWQLDLTDGPMTILNHSNWMGFINGILCLRARYRFEENDPAGAIEDLADAMVVARHTATDGTLVSLLVGYRNEARDIEVLAHYLPAQGPALLEELAERLDALPEFPKLCASLRAEKEWFLDWARRYLEENGADALRHALVNLLDAGDKESAELTQAARGGKEQLIKLLDETGPYYDKAVSILELRLEKFDGAVAEFAKELDEANPIARAVLGGEFKALSVRYREAQAEARLAMLKAAIAVVRDGPEAVARSKDAFGDGPFGYRKTEDGFVLESALKIEGKPFRMSFGRGAGGEE